MNREGTTGKDSTIVEYIITLGNIVMSQYFILQIASQIPQSLKVMVMFSTLEFLYFQLVLQFWIEESQIPVEVLLGESPLAIASDLMDDESLG